MHLLEKKTLAFIKEFEKFQIEVNNDKNAVSKLIKLAEVQTNKQASGFKKEL